MPEDLKGNNDEDKHLLAEMNMTGEGFCLLYMILEFCLLTQLGGKI